jgi:hypothetical protein
MYGFLLYRYPFYNQIFFGKNSFWRFIMQANKTRAYLTQRVKQALRVEELDVKDMPLNTLMSAYASVYEHGDAGNDHRISMKIPALATYYAKQLCEGKFVVVRDPFDNKTYYIKAHHEDLIAVSYAMGPWSNFYAIKSTSDHALRELNITSAVINDLKIIDRIFGFRSLDSESAETDNAPATAVVQNDCVKWAWHTGHAPAKKKDEAQLAELAEVEARVPVAEPVGAVGAPAPGVETVQLGGNQMQRAFQHAGQPQQGHQGRRERRHANERRAHELNTPEQGGKQS